jgi:hypothetical protein
MFRSLLALLMILVAAPANADSRLVGGFRGAGFHHGGFHHHGGFPPFHHRGGHARRFFGGYVCGYDCGWDFDSAGYGYGYGGYDTGYGDGYDKSYRNGYGYGSGYVGGERNDVSISNGSSGGYVPDPVGADIPPLIIPTNCWVRRAAYDPSGAYFGQVLVNLCRPSDRVTVTSLKARAKMPETATVPAEPPPVDQSSSPQLPH